MFLCCFQEGIEVKLFVWDYSIIIGNSSAHVKSGVRDVCLVTVKSFLQNIRERKMISFILNMLDLVNWMQREACTSRKKGQVEIYVK